MKPKESKLIQWFNRHPRVLIALSGGVDSCLVAFMARKVLGKENAIAVMCVSPSLKTKDYAIVVEFCLLHDIELIEITTNEINDPNYAMNPINRCYFCKSHLYKSMHSLRIAHYADYLLVNGSNLSDLGDYRPGLRAAEEQKAYSPLAECGFTKDDIRKLAQTYHLSVWDKPASPCLSSRFPYGEKITVDKLKMVEKAEELLDSYGFSNVRVRYYNNKARIEVPANEIKLLNRYMKILLPKFIAFGFEGCEIDKEGLVSGKLNRIITGKISSPYDHLVASHPSSWVPDKNNIE